LPALLAQGHGRRGRQHDKAEDRAADGPERLLPFAGSRGVLRMRPMGKPDAQSNPSGRRLLRGVLPVLQRTGEGGQRGMSPTCPTLARLHARETLLLAALLAGKGLTDAATAAGVSRRTGLRIRSRPEFQTALRAARDELLAGVIDKLRSDANGFADTLHQLATDQKARGSDRVLAARHGLDLLLRGVETLDFSERLGRLEQIASGGRK
jgi:hypothetical protein